jgi:hypothetical protein
MSNYNIRSKISTLLVSTIMSLSCTYIVCMETNDARVEFGIQIVEKRIAKERLIWERRYVGDTRKAAIELYKHFKTLDYYEKNARTPESIISIISRKGCDENKRISPETLTKIFVYHGALQKCKLPENIEKAFASQVRKDPRPTDYRKVSKVLKSVVNDRVIHFGDGQLSDFDKAALGRIAHVADREHSSSNDIGLI